MTAPSKVKILFLAADPVAAAVDGSSQRLRLDEEIRTISAKIRTSEYRDAIEIIPCLAATADDLMHALLQHKPHVVHFSGHGSQDGEIVVRNEENGSAKAISAAALTSTLAILCDNLRLVFLNSCLSQIHAEALQEAIDCSITMSKPITDKAALAFASSFYRAIGFGRSLQEAFDLGKAAIMLQGYEIDLLEHETPELTVKSGVDPSEIRLVSPEQNIPPPKNPLFEAIWNSLDEELQNAFLLAGGAASREGKEYISTTQLFMALRKLSPSPLSDFFDRLPDGALPESTPYDVAVEDSALDSITSLSPCVNAAVSNLIGQTNDAVKIKRRHVC